MSTEHIQFSCSVVSDSLRPQHTRPQHARPPLSITNSQSPPKPMSKPITDAEAETPVFWSSGWNSWLIGKVPDAVKDWGLKEKRAWEEMAGWHHQCNEYELGQTSGVGEGQGDLACCSPWACKKLDTTGWLNNTKWFPTNRCYVEMDTPNASDVSSKERNPDFHPNFKSSS